MKYNCEIIRDLIPLYIDDIASDASRQMIEEHFCECEECKKIAEQMKSEEIEKNISDEKEDVISSQKKYFNRRSASKGILILGIIIVAAGACFFFAGAVINLILGNSVSLPQFAPLVWGVDTTDGNVQWLVLIGTCLIGAILIIIGLIKGRRKGMK